MTNRRLFSRIANRVPITIRYISLTVPVCLALIAGHPIPQVSNARGSATDDRNPIAGKWYTFTSPDGDFTLAFPRKPILQDVSQGPVTLIRTFTSTLENGMNFSVNFHDVGGDPQARENNEFRQDQEELLSAADREGGIRVVQTHRLAKNVIESEVWQTVPEPADADINYLRRSILRQGRVYTLACGWLINRKAVDKPTCAKFFNSMRFMHGAKH